MLHPHLNMANNLKYNKNVLRYGRLPSHHENKQNFSSGHSTARVGGPRRANSVAFTGPTKTAHDKWYHTSHHKKQPRRPLRQKALRLSPLPKKHPLGHAPQHPSSPNANCQNDPVFARWYSGEILLLSDKRGEYDRHSTPTRSRLMQPQYLVFGPTIVAPSPAKIILSLKT